MYLLIIFLQFPFSPPDLLTLIYGSGLHAYSNMSNEALGTTSMFYIEKKWGCEDRALANAKRYNDWDTVSFVDKGAYS